MEADEVVKEEKAAREFELVDKEAGEYGRCVVLEELPEEDKLVVVSEEIGFRDFK